MYLTRLTLNPRSRQVQRELADPYQMHRTVLSAFPVQLNNQERVLYRLEQDNHTGLLNLLVQSQGLPEWRHLPAHNKDYLLPDTELPAGWQNPAVKQYNPKLQPGQMLAFRLRANPTVKKDREGETQGRRVGLYKEAEQINWLQRKISNSGGELIIVQISQKDKLIGYQFRESQKRNLTFFSIQFEGTLKVINPAQLVEAIMHGIGSGKGFGFGLLSLAPIPS